MDNKYSIIYSQFSWHDEAVIIGNTKYLIELRDKINKILENNLDYEIVNSFLHADGEGYATIIIKEDDEKILGILETPYLHETDEGLAIHIYLINKKFDNLKNDIEQDILNSYKTTNGETNAK